MFTSVVFAHKLVSDGMLLHESEIVSCVHFHCVGARVGFEQEKKGMKKREISIYIGGNQNVFMIHDFLFSSRLNMMINLASKTDHS